MRKTAPLLAAALLLVTGSPAAAAKPGSLDKTFSGDGRVSLEFGPGNDVEAGRDLVLRGEAVLPALLEALERRDVELRRQAFEVVKQVREGRTLTQVEPLTGSARQEELAQMLGGVSEATLRSAEEILQAAHQQEQSIRK